MKNTQRKKKELGKRGCKAKVGKKGNKNRGRKKEQQQKIDIMKEQAEE